MADGKRLTFEDISRLHDRQEEIKRANSAYLSEHPELKNLVADFTAAILMQKPDDVFKFARDHFSVYLKDSKQKDSSAVYYAKHVISGRRYEVVITTTKDRARWLVVAAKDLSPHHPSFTTAFSASEVMTAFELAQPNAEEAAVHLSRHLRAQGSDLILTDDPHASPTVEEYDASVKIQAVGRSRQQRLQVSV